MLRSAEPKDAEVIGIIRVAAWRAAYQKFMPEDFLADLDPKENLTELKERLSVQSPDFNLSVAEKQGEIVAFSIVSKPRYKTNARTIELWALNVLPEYWGVGIGSGLVERAVRYSYSVGFRNIELWCINGNVPAQKAYEKLGFIQSGQSRATSQLTGHKLHELHYVKRL